MKICDLQIDVIEHQMPNLEVTEDPAIGGMRERGLLRIFSDEGLEGNCFIGEYWGRAHIHFDPILKIIKPLLIGRDITDREWLWGRVQHLHARLKLTDQNWAPVDIALWDLAGKTAGQPIYQLLGAANASVPAYATYPARFDNPENFADEAREVVDAGFKAYKLHPGTLDTKTAIATIHRVREAVGDDITLMYDPNCGYDYQKALAVGLALDDAGYYWFEDPVRAHDIDAITELSRRLKTPLCMCDQSTRQFFDAAHLIRCQALRMVRGTSYKLGITGLYKLSVLAEAFGLRCEVGTAGNETFNAANLHAILAMHNCSFYEFILPTTLDRFGLVEHMEIDAEGNMQAPDRPGLGVQLDWSWLNHHKTTTLE